MARSKQLLSEVEIATRIKKGRGSGQGSTYQPWIKVDEIPSLGRSHRIWSHKTQRIHHLLSDLELSVFMMLQWHPDVTDIMEQYPLNRDETRALANQYGIKHPQVHGIDQVMSSDFLVRLKDKQSPQMAIQVKPTDDLSKKRTVEKLELERRYWLSKRIPWYLITDKEISPIVKTNLDWFLQEKTEDICEESMLNQCSFLSHVFQ